MGQIKPQILQAKVRHKRLSPRKNEFCYAYWALLFDICDSEALKLPYLFAVNNTALLSFQDKDHGFKDKRSSFDFAKVLFAEAGIDLNNKRILMLTMPRIFWFCF